jgi:hypothetical protein
MESNDKEKNKSVSKMEIHGAEARQKLITKRRVYKSMAAK